MEVYTERLLMREYRLEDADFILRLLNSPGWLRYIGDRGIDSVGKAEDYIQNRLQKGYERDGFGFYHVSLRETGEGIGMCGLVRREGLEEPDIGFALLPEYFGKGYAYEMAAATVDLARDRFGIGTLLAITLPENEASIRLIEKIGLKFEKKVCLPGDSEEVMLFRGDF